MELRSGRLEDGEESKKRGCDGGGLAGALTLPSTFPFPSHPLPAFLTFTLFSGCSLTARFLHAVPGVPLAGLKHEED